MERGWRKNIRAHAT